MLMGVRDRLVRTRTQLANAIRGYAAEFGLGAAKGMAQSSRCSTGSRRTRRAGAGPRPVRAPGQENCRLEAEIAEVDARLMAWHRADECGRRLAQVPGIGPDHRVDADDEDSGARAVPFRPATSPPGSA